MAAPVLQEQFFSSANLFWFFAGLAAEIAFLGIGASPMGMAWGTQVATTLGLIDPVTATAGVSSVMSPAGVSTFTF
jgi:hypothetical protein